MKPSGGEACELCGESGITSYEALEREVDRVSRQHGVEWIDGLGPLLAAWNMIGRYGLDAWMDIEGRPDPLMFDAIAELESTMAAMELDDRQQSAGART